MGGRFTGAFGTGTVCTTAGCATHSAGVYPEMTEELGEGSGRPATALTSAGVSDSGSSSSKPLTVAAFMPLWCGWGGG